MLDTTQKLFVTNSCLYVFEHPMSEKQFKAFVKRPSKHQSSEARIVKFSNCIKMSYKDYEEDLKKTKDMRGVFGRALYPALMNL